MVPAAGFEPATYGLQIPLCFSGTNHHILMHAQPLQYRSFCYLCATFFGAEMADRLTDVSIRNLQPVPSGQYDVWDSAVTGLGVRVNTGGSKSFVLIYRLGTL